LSQISDLAYSYFGLVGPVTVRTAGAIRMLRQLLVSIAVSVCNIAIHAIVMAAVLWAARVASERAMSHRSFSADRRHDGDRIGFNGGAYC
jgi:hypothetical protein